MSEFSLEMSGPLCGVLQGTVARSPSDGLAILVGAKLKSQAREQTDLGSQEVARLRMVVKDIVMVEQEDVLDPRGCFRVKNIKDIVETRYKDKVKDPEVMKLLGFLKFRKDWDSEWGMEPSYQDTRLIRALKKSSSPKVFHLMAEGRDTTSAPGIEVLRVSSVTLVMGGDKQLARIPLTVPNLPGSTQDQTGYKLYSTGSSALVPLLEAAGLNREAEKLSKVKDKYVSLNLLLGEGVEEKGAAVLQLEQEADSLEEEVAKLEEELEERLGQGAEYLRLLALQGGLLGALQQAMEDITTCRDRGEVSEEEVKREISEEKVRVEESEEEMLVGDTTEEDEDTKSPPRALNG